MKFIKLSVILRFERAGILPPAVQGRAKLSLGLLRPFRMLDANLISCSREAVVQKRQTVVNWTSLGARLLPPLLLDTPGQYGLFDELETAIG